MKDVFVKVRVTIFAHDLNCTAVEENTACHCKRELLRGDVVHILDSFPGKYPELRCFVAVTERGMTSFYLPVAEIEAYFDATYECPTPVSRAA